ncbi:hypothetical protein SORBI_3004G340900 [Sorghum bicolor]|uniref:F-box domain-containing protein n=2 Tax=Sorghum bicolor TaxID=4558 RepID=C5XV94_SORBI|nr:hypothetical protein SORBI_3004G340900 [Sorghum bicolor]
MESTAPARCEIARLPEDLVSATLARTAPRDACRAAAVSPAFRAAADADAVWSGLLPRDLPPLADGELPADPLPKKQLFMRLSDPGCPVLLADRLTSMWLDRATAAKCYMLSARKLGIVWGDTPQYWRWIPLTLTDSRFSECAELLAVCWLEIRGKIHCKMLSQNTTYAAYMVFKMSDRSYGLDLDYPPQRAEVSTGVTKSTRRVCLQVYDSEGEDHRGPPMEHVHHAQTRTDGWMEMEMGEFNNEECEDGEVSISLTGRGGHWKRGLILHGIEIRVKK